MKKQDLEIIAFAIFFLFFIQLAGTLVESIYILDLMNTSLDEKALGLLFFFTPVLLLFYPKKRPGPTAWTLFGLLFLSRSAIPYLDTLGRMLAAGIGTGSALMLFPFLISTKVEDDSSGSPGLRISAGLALAVGFSVLLRTINFGLDYSLHPEGAWVGWVLAAALGLLMTLFDWKTIDQTQSKSRSITLAITGVFLIIGLVWFAFSAPSVISRWTEGNYRLIVITVSLMALAWVGLSLYKPGWLNKISPISLVIWNLLFSLSLVMTILAHRVTFPQTPAAPSVLVGSPTWIQQVPLVFLLLLFPVIFIDLGVFSSRIKQIRPGPRDFIPGMLLGSFSLVILVFTHIFTNVWGYVEPVSPWFRNKFWLPYLLMAGLVTLLIGWKGLVMFNDQPKPGRKPPWGWAVLLGALFLGTGGSVLLSTRVQSFEPQNNKLIVMTYNIQQANDDFGERSYPEQLALIRQVKPDILVLQESDSSRISLNNNDFVRYYAGKLGYHSYYGPTTVTGTYGTAILSRYPLQNTGTIFTFSDQDEIGTSEAEIEISGQLFTIYNVHPDGSDTAMLVWAESLLERSEGKINVIALGDYNLRDYEQPYQLISNVYTNAWESVYPTKISPTGLDMSGNNRIDHIFYSSPLAARNPEYVLPPESATDHPVHWTEIIWD
jgi:endonuclease/exonuclease/phosphatase family metal-dependent hydrolase